MILKTGESPQLPRNSHGAQHCSALQHWAQPCTAGGCADSFPRTASEQPRPLLLAFISGKEKKPWKCYLHKYCNFYCSFHSFGRNISKLYSYSLKNLCLFSNLNLPGFDCQSASLVLLIVRSKRVVLGIFCVWRYSCTVIKTFSDKLSQAVFSLPLWHFTLH